MKRLTKDNHPALAETGQRTYLIEVIETTTYRRWFEASSENAAINATHDHFLAVGPDDFAIGDTDTDVAVITSE